MGTKGLKVSKIIGVIARLRHFVPLCNLINTYRSLIFPYMSYGLAAWGQAAKTHLQKLLVLLKLVLRLMYFSEPRADAVSLFITSNILPINMLSVETVSSLIYDVRMGQFVLKIEKLSHIIGPRASQDLRSPSPIMAPG